MARATVSLVDLLRADAKNVEVIASGNCDREGERARPVNTLCDAEGSWIPRIYWPRKPHRSVHDLLYPVGARDRH